MRKLEAHRINPTNDKLVITVEDEPGAGGAHHLYQITGFDTFGNPSSRGAHRICLSVLFQNGPIAEFGVNGVTQEALLAIIEDRLASFQAGPYASTYNAEALEHVRLALWALHARTLERMGRGVEGTHAK